MAKSSVGPAEGFGRVHALSLEFANKVVATCAEFAKSFPFGGEFYKSHWIPLFFSIVAIQVRDSRIWMSTFDKSRRSGVVCLSSILVPFVAARFTPDGDLFL